MNAKGPGEEEITTLLMEVQVAAVQWEAPGYFWGTHPQAVLSKHAPQGQTFQELASYPNRAGTFSSLLTAAGVNTQGNRGVCVSLIKMLLSGLASTLVLNGCGKERG